MKVSVIIPAYNEEKYIGKCLESLSKQIDPPDEIIVVDNNSKDKTQEIARKYNVKIVLEKKQGMIPARNAGFEAATGDIIARCDSDTVLPGNWILEIKKQFKDVNIDGLTGPTYFYDLPYSPKTTLYTKLYIQYMRWKLDGNDVLLGPNMVITKRAWNRVKNEVCLNDKIVHEDIDLSIHMIKAGMTIVSSDEMLIGMSCRRIIKNPQSFFLEYVKRSFKTFDEHNK